MSYDELMSEYKKMQAENIEMQEKNKKMQAENIEMQAENKKIRLENESLGRIIENQQLELNTLKKVIFGQKREYTPKKEQLENVTQCSLFDDNENVEKEIKEQVQEKTEEITVHKRKDSKKKKAGIKKEKLNNIETEIVRSELNKDEKCPICGGNLKKVSEKLAYQELVYVPGYFKLVNHFQTTCKCENCGTKESENEIPTFVKTNVPKPILSHSFASPSLAAEVIYQKYYMGVPLYRQEKVWDDRGLVLPRNMMANWNIKITQYYLESLYNLMLEQLKDNCELLHCDETTIQCNKEKGRKASTNSYMWVLCSGEQEENKGVVFKYEPSRSSETAKKFLNGYTGILVTDGYAAYNEIEGITHAECWAHCRRYFYESVPLDEHKQMDTSCEAYKGVEFCNELFKIEEEIAELNNDQKLKIRQEKSAPILKNFFNWVTLVSSKKIVLNNKLNKALTYASNQRKELSEFLNDARIPLTNSRAERTIRPFAIHRKNWLFADTVEGAKTNAVMYSLIESAKLNNLNIEKYYGKVSNEVLEVFQCLNTKMSNEEIVSNIIKLIKLLRR